MTIVVAYTPTPAAEAALTFGISEAKLRGERLVVINSSKGTARVDTRLASDEQLSNLDAQLASSGIEHLLEQPNGGKEAVEEILDSAERHEASMIIIGTRHRSPVGKFIMGSTAQQIILDSPVPVVAVKATTEGHRKRTHRHD
ncbi:universal stress protein UspA [Paenarthrobacter nitroguajacolicus]|uniref:universal stress protein n=1 Tax=Paenarthrobacter nitroguajacolicus TaxID=211146 RepID=UPI0015BC95D5|nr:universal stress protein [Paenarthrobacter nitroguajacolicus]NWL10326.1 universal stress protein UspA [Paenarthrobacter nitroguajacolicus]